LVKANDARHRWLRGEHREIRGQGMRLAVNRHDPFLHRLQQGGLRFCRSAIDFIGEQERSEDRAFDERKLVALQIEDVRAGDIGGHQVGRKLDT
jgi:hypothetical protein